MGKGTTKAVTKRINILLADDDTDDNLYFARALKSVSFPTKIKFLEDGEKLMKHLEKKKPNFPDILFLDLNMPRKNGLECLTEIRASQTIEKFPIIIYSTSLNKSVADECYEKGAQYYIKKGEFNDLIKHLEFVLEKFTTNDLENVTKDQFVLELAEA